MKNQIVSFSGGKDSTAMLLEMLERGESIHSIIALDTGWEFPQMLEHWERVEQYIGIEIIRLYPIHDFDFYMMNSPCTRAGEKEPYRQGVGYPSSMRRWCTSMKVSELEKYKRKIENPVSCIGYAFDEMKRTEGKNINSARYETRFPLVEWEITEKQALDICYKHGFDWGGLYEHFDRVSCYCCPLKGLKDARIIRKNFPELWAGMLEKDIIISSREENSRYSYYHGDSTLHDLDRRFAEEERLGADFNIRQYNKERRKNKNIG